MLHRLELNLDPLLGRLPVSVSRAYARQLQLSIPWTALATQPIQARGSTNCSGRVLLQPWLVELASMQPHAVHV